MISLPDVNVLLALAWANHQHHDAAHLWFQRAAAAVRATGPLPLSYAARAD